MIRKTMTNKAVAANQENSNKSTGPKTEEGKRTVSSNAEKLGLSAKRQTFRTSEEHADYLRDMRELQENPRRAMKRMLCEKLALAKRNLGRVQKEMDVFQDRRAKSKEILRQLLEQSNDVVEGTDLITGAEFSAGPLGWDADELSIRISRTYSTGHDSDGKSMASGNNQVNHTSGFQSTGYSTETESTGHWEFDAKLSSPEDRISRQKNSLDHEFFRTIEKLLAMEEKEEEE